MNYQHLQNGKVQKLQCGGDASQCPILAFASDTQDRSLPHSKTLPPSLKSTAQESALGKLIWNIQ